MLRILFFLCWFTVYFCFLIGIVYFCSRIISLLKNLLWTDWLLYIPLFSSIMKVLITMICMIRYCHSENVSPHSCVCCISVWGTHVRSIDFFETCIFTIALTLRPVQFFWPLWPWMYFYLQNNNIIYIIIIV